MAKQKDELPDVLLSITKADILDAVAKESRFKTEMPEFWVGVKEVFDRDYLRLMWRAIVERAARNGLDAADIAIKKSEAPKIVAP